MCFCILIGSHALRVQRAAPFFDKINALLQGLAQGTVKVLHLQRTQRLYAGQSRSALVISAR